MHTQDQAKAKFYAGKPAPVRIHVDLKVFDAFLERLDRHDWQFEYSDDGSVWRRGHTNHTQLIEVSNGHPILKRAFDAYCERHYRGMSQESLDAVIYQLRNSLWQAQAQSQAHHLVA